MDMDWRATRNLLCVCLDGAGGVLRSASTFVELQQASPRRKVTLLSTARGVEAARLLSGVDHLIAHRAATHHGLRYALELLDFDGAVVLDDDSLQATQLCEAAGIPLVT